MNNREINNSKTNTLTILNKKNNKNNLLKNVFDPINNSPPNDFFIKLQIRLASQKINSEKRINT
jgi:hypothetical protein